LQCAQTSWRQEASNTLPKVQCSAIFVVENVCASWPGTVQWLATKNPRWSNLTISVAIFAYPPSSRMLLRINGWFTVETINEASLAGSSNVVWAIDLWMV
jgi:hypothetical protein